jgi:hypothetical protein
MLLPFFCHWKIFQATLKMRIRISYVSDGSPVLEQTEVSKFPGDSFD